MSKSRNQHCRHTRKRHAGYWKKREGRVTLDAEQAAELRLLCYHAKWMASRWERGLGPALQTLGSHHATDCHAHIVMAAKMAHAMQRAAGTLPDRT